MLSKIYGLRKAVLCVLFVSILGIGWGQQLSCINAAWIDYPNVPVLDGQIGQQEWQEASMAPVLLAKGGNRLAETRGWFAISILADDVYFAFWTDMMKQAPTASVRTRDGKVWLDDSVEFRFQEPETKNTLVLIINSEGIFYDAMNENSSWNGDITVAAKPIGNVWDFGAQHKRGFAVEGKFNLPRVFGKSPSVGEQWGMQVVLHLTSGECHASWSPVQSFRIADSPLGKIFWRGPKHRLTEVLFDFEKEQQQVIVKGITSFGITTAVFADGQLISGTSKRWGEFTIALGVVAGAENVIRLDADGQFVLEIPVLPPLKMPVFVCPAPSYQAFWLELDPKYIQAPIEEVVVEFKKNDQILWQKRFVSEQLRRYHQEFISWKQWDADQVDLLVSVDGRQVYAKPMRCAKHLSTELILPNLPAVPQPWQPLKMEDKKVKTLTQEYTLGAPYLDQISVLSNPLLAAPIYFTANEELSGQSWRVLKFEKETLADDKIVWLTEAVCGQRHLKTQTTIEFDGAIFVDTEVLEADDGEWQLVIPLKRNLIKYLASPGFLTDALPEGEKKKFASFYGDEFVPESAFALPYTSCLWLGNEKIGLCFFSFYPSEFKEGKPFLIKPSEDRLDLIVRLNRKIIQSGRKKISFGLMATPAKQPSNTHNFGSRLYAIPGYSVLTGKLGLRDCRLLSNPLDTREYFPPRGAAIFILNGMALSYQNGCVEMEFVPLWDKPDYIIPLIRLGDTWADRLALALYYDNHQKDIFLVNTQPGKGEVLIASVPFEFQKNQRYRLALNFGPTIQIILDGQVLYDKPFEGILPAWQYGQLAEVDGVWLGRGGRIALAAWRYSNRQRRPDELQGRIPEMEDEATAHLQTLAGDPTILRWAPSTVNTLASPAYLHGNWRYDKANRLLVAGGDLPEMLWAEYLAKIGVNGVKHHYWSKTPGGVGQGGVDDPARYQKVAQLCNRLGIRILNYSPWGTNNTDPDYPVLKYEISTVHPRISPPPAWVESGVESYSCIPVGVMRASLLKQVQDFMVLGGGGCYYDGYFGPATTTNPLHGVFYHEAENKYLPFVETRGKREFFKTLWRMLSTYRPDFMIDSHWGPTPYIPIASFQNESLNIGEWMPGVDWKEWLTPAHYRAWDTASKLGTNADVIMYANQMPLEALMALTNVHGHTPRAGSGMLWARAEALWALAKKFDTNTAKFIRYDSPDSPITVSNINTLCSTYLHKSQRALLVMTHWSDAVCEEKIKLDLEKMGFSSNISITLLNSNSQLDMMEKDTVFLKMKPRLCYYLWIQNEPKTSD